MKALSINTLHKWTPGREFWHKCFTIGHRVSRWLDNAKAILVVDEIEVSLSRKIKRL